MEQFGADLTASLIQIMCKIIQRLTFSKPLRNSGK